MQEVCQAVRVDAHHMACFTDGSLFKQAWAQSWRAGWGVFLDLRARPAFRLFGPVPGIEQTVPSAEWAAAIVAANFWPHTAAPPWADCQQVVDGINHHVRFIKQGGLHAGAAREALAIASRNCQPLFKMSKVKAHQVINDAMPLGAQRAAEGNAQADLAAKQGAKTHPQPSPVELVMANFSWRLLLECAVAVGKILPLFPTAAEQFGGRLAWVGGGGCVSRQACRGRMARPTVVDPSHRHKFATIGGAIMCEKCLTRVQSWKAAASKTDMQACEGHSQQMAIAFKADRIGHTLQLISHSGVATVVCVRCGAFSAFKCKLLALPCRGAAGMSVKRKGGLARLRKGRHPDDRQPGFFDAAWHIRDGELFDL